MGDTGTEKFIDWAHRENVARLRDMLENSSGARHGTLLKLLLDEERLLGCTREQLDEMDPADRAHQAHHRTANRDR